MRSSMVLALALATLAVTASSAVARPRADPAIIECTQQGCAPTQPSAREPAARAGAARGTKPASVAGDPRPAAWCAWWLRRYLNIPISAFPAGAYNLARAFADIGTDAGGPAEGVIVVWPRGSGGHVGIITGPQVGDEWLVKSGNDGHGVRTRLRSVKGAIAFRWPPGRGFAAL